VPPKNSLWPTFFDLGELQIRCFTNAISNAALTIARISTVAHRANRRRGSANCLHSTEPFSSIPENVSKHSMSADLKAHNIGSIFTARPIRITLRSRFPDEIHPVWAANYHRGCYESDSFRRQSIAVVTSLNATEQLRSIRSQRFINSQRADRVRLLGPEYCGISFGSLTLNT